MKILFYSPHSQLYFEASTGYGSHMRGMVEAFQEMGHEVEVLVMGEKPKSHLSEKHVPVQKKKFKKFVPKIIWRSLKELKWMQFDSFAQKKLMQKIQSFQPDLIYERSAWMSNGSIRIIKKYGIHHVVEINAPFEEETKAFEGSGSLIHFIGKYKFKNLLKSCTAIASINSELTRVLSSRYGIEQKKFIFTPNAISKNEIQMALHSKHPEPFAHLKDKKVFGFVGSILPYHGVDLCIRAFAKIKMKNVHLLIVGDGYLIPEYEKICKELQISNQVTFTGSIPKKEIWNYLSVMDVLLLPSTAWYCSPVKLFEYALMEKPIIAINKPGVLDIFSEKSCALFSGSEDELLKRFQEFINQPEMYKCFGTLSKEIVLERHQWTNNARAILNYFES
jgi:glycosyltransferase involved in cell wall biosynthesis